MLKCCKSLCIQHSLMLFRKHHTSAVQKKKKKKRGSSNFNSEFLWFCGFIPQEKLTIPRYFINYLGWSETRHVEGREDKWQLSFQQHLNVVSSAKVDWMDARFHCGNRQVHLIKNNIEEKHQITEMYSCKIPFWE